MTKKERIEQLRMLNEPDYSAGTTPYIVGDEEGYQRGITKGYGLGYDEAIDKACEWLKARNVLTEASLEGFRKAMEE